MPLISPSEYREKKGQGGGSPEPSGLIPPSSYKQMQQVPSASEPVESVYAGPPIPTSVSAAPTVAGTSLPGRDLPVIGPVLRGLDAVSENPIVEKVAEIGRTLYTPGAGLANVGSAYQAAGALVGKVAPGLGSTLGGRVAQEAAKEALVGVPTVAGQVVASGNNDLGEAAKEGLLYGGLGGAAIGAAGPLVKAGAKQVLEQYRQLPQVQQRQAGKELLQQIETAGLPVDLSARVSAPGSSDALLPSSGTAQAVDTVTRRAAAGREYEQAVSDQLDYLQQSMRDRGGVEQGGIIRDQAGDVTGRFGRVSNNPPWYQDFYQQYGRAPTQADLRTLAEEQVRKGFRTETGPAPAWQPNVLREIDDELANIDTMLPGASEADRAALTQVRSVLTSERERLARAMPVEDLATAARSQSGVPAPSQTADMTFKTSKGSTYTVGGNGSTVRNKSLHQGHDPKDVGLKEPSELTVYVDKTESSRIGSHMSLNKDARPQVLVRDDGVYLISWNPKENRWGIHGKPIPYTKQPEVGRSPVEFWKMTDDAQLGRRAGKVHAGNEITEITRPGSANPDAPQLLTTFTPSGRPQLPAGGTGPMPEAPTKLSEIVAYLSRELDIPIRVGRYRYNAHGLFKPHSRVIRTNLANDLPTISHEIGHNLDKKFSLSQSTAFDAELVQLGQATSGSNYTPDQVKGEGIAEFFRRLLTDPADARAGAPAFYAHVAQTLPANVKQALQTAQKQIAAYVDQPLHAKVLSKMSIGEKEKRRLPGWDDFYKTFVDEYQPIRKALKEAGPDGEKLMRNFALLRGVTGRAQAFLKHGVVDANYNRVGKSFQEILEPVKANLNEFRAYLTAKRAVELEDRNIMTASDLEQKDWMEEVFDLQQRFPEFQAAQKKLLDYQDAVLNELVSSGVLSKESVAKFRKENQDYVPFFRVYEAEAGGGAVRGGTTSTGGSIANQRSPIKRIKGSTRDIVDPLESIVKNTYQYITIAERNKVMRELVTVAEGKGGLGGLVEKVDTPMQATTFSLDDIRKTLEHAGADTDNMNMDAIVSLFKPSQHIPGKDNVVAVYDKGVRRLYQLDADLYKAVTAADKDQMNLIVRALNFPVRLLRSGIVNTLEFWLRNMWRDQFSAAINTQNGYIPWVDMFRGMAHVLKKDDVFTKFLAAGGAQGLRQSLDRQYLQHDIRNILAVSMKDKTMNIIKNPLEAMRALSEYSELGTRLGEFSRGLKKDSSAEGIRAAAASSRDLIDFSRAGSAGKNINKVSAFWNASVQGLDKSARAFFRENPKKNFTKALALVTAPTAGLYMANRNDPRYQELPQWDKDLFWHFWAGETHFRLPIPFELGVVFKVLPERLMAALDGVDQPLRKLGDTVRASVPVPTTLPDAVGFLSALSPLAEVMANQNFAKAPIVPRREEGLRPEDQYGPYTSEITKGVSKLAGMAGLEDSFAGSPRKLEHIITGYTGSLGKYALQTADKAAGLTGIADRPTPPASGVEDWPGFKAFIGKSMPDSTETIDRFYERMDELNRGKASAGKNAETYDAAGEAKVYSRINRQISELRGVYRLTLEDRDLSPIEKRARLNELSAQMNELAHMGLNITKELQAAR